MLAEEEFRHPCATWREGGRERQEGRASIRDGGRETKRERQEGRASIREGGREGGREKERERGREGGREGRRSCNSAGCNSHMREV